MSNFLSNDWHEIILLKLDPCPSSEGPFVVLQEGASVEDPEKNSRVWILRTDGIWIPLATHVSLPEGEKAPVWFDEIREVIDLFVSLPTTPKVFWQVRKEGGQAKDEVPTKIERLNIEWIRERVQEWKSVRAKFGT